jgi:hypothetical protein
MKKRQIKVWPEAVHYLTAVNSYADYSGKDNDIKIDFSDCQYVTSTGLTILLLQTLKSFEGGDNRRGWEADDSEKYPIFDTVKHLAFFDHLNQYYRNTSLFNTDITNYNGPFKAIEHKFLYGRKIISLPIMCINFSQHESGGAGRRKAMKAFKGDLFPYLCKLELSYRFQANILTSIFCEMVKNSADHTQDDAFFGMDIIKIPENNSCELHFVLGDLGKGIKQHIQDNLQGEHKLKRGNKWSLYESYYFALKHGYTSRPENQINKGFGMSIILDGASCCNMSLSVFDASSRGLLSSLEGVKHRNVTHSELRKHFFKFTNNKVFFYYGAIEMEAL